MRMDDETFCEGQLVLPLEGTVPCIVCGRPTPIEYDEPCDDCMNPEPPREVGEYTDGYGNDYGWQDSTFPNEY